MQITLTPPKTTLVGRLLARLGGHTGRPAGSSSRWSAPDAELIARHRDRAYSASFTGIPVLATRRSDASKGMWL